MMMTFDDDYDGDDDDDDHDDDNDGGGGGDGDGDNGVMVMMKKSIEKTTTTPLCILHNYYNYIAATRLENFQGGKQGN